MMIKKLRLRLVMGCLVSLFTSCSLEHNSSNHTRIKDVPESNSDIYHYYGPSTQRPDQDIQIPATGRDTIHKKETNKEV